MNAKMNDRPIYLVQAEVFSDRHIYLPFSIMFLGKALVNAGWRVRLFHLHPGEESRLYQAIREEEPLFMGVSSIIGASLKRLVNISRDVHEMGVPLVWGGPFASMVPEIVLKSGYIQYVVMGEGEKNTPLLAEAICEGQVPVGIPGVGYMDQDQIHLEPPADVEPDLDLFEPGWELVPLEQYSPLMEGTDKRFFQIYFSRGCPFNCSYCYNRISPQQKIWRTHSLEYFQAQLDYLNRHLPSPIENLSLIGDNAFGNVKQAKYLIENMGVRWGAGLRIEVVDEEFVRWCRDSKALYLGFGFESASEKMQNIYDRGTMPDQFRRALGLLNELDVTVGMGVMFMAPGETIEDRRQTVEVMEELYLLNQRTFFNTFPFYAYPRTTIWERCLREGFKAPETLEEWSVRFIEFMRVHNWTPRRWARAYTASQLLYGMPLMQNSLKPGWWRNRWYRRFWNFSFRLPVEEAVRLRQKSIFGLRV
jgi:anaerobic magnesium-protoporphyrin IX monomethyl ester cyclase